VAGDRGADSASAREPRGLEAGRDALRTHELVKVQLNKTAGVTATEAANTLAERVRAEVIQVIGRTASLYRHTPDLKRKAGGLPPWRT
jgi:RNA-binding protein